MLCSRPRPLNASATVAGLPDAQRERPSRAAGSFFGHKQPGFSVRETFGYCWRIGWGKGRTAFWRRRAGLLRAGRHKRWGTRITLRRPLSGIRPFKGTPPSDAVEPSCKSLFLEG